MSATAVLPVVWAMGPMPVVPERPVELEVAFYRKYTEGVLRRYLRMSMEAGKVPSLIGREMFRSKVTNYRMHSFEDVVIFVHDVERCLEQLDREQRLLISRIAIQSYTNSEAAGLMGLSHRTVIRRYGLALDRLTRIFLSVKLLEPMEGCQEEEVGQVAINC
jgi:hypothetical protein